MNHRFPTLQRNQQSGSKPRCHLLTCGHREEVASRLSSLIYPWATVRGTDRWMPAGFDSVDEAQLHDAPGLIDPTISGRLFHWWLAAGDRKTRTPHWDIASTCLIGGREGLLLIEAKAHDQELIKEETGRKGLETPVLLNSRRNHARIGWCLEDASLCLTTITGAPWRLSRDSHYQLSNRFAWGWKLADLGIPVVLVYLGFLNAAEMSKQSAKGAAQQSAFATHADWEALVRSHSASLLPQSAWESQIDISGTPLIALIRSLDIALSEEVQRVAD